MKTNNQPKLSLKNINGCFNKVDKSNLHFVDGCKSRDRIPINCKLEKDTRYNFRKQILQKPLKKYKGTPDSSGDLLIR